jgi:hypothetical protein
MKSTAGLEWGAHAGVIETLLNNTRKQAESALKSLDKFRSDPRRYRPQLKNVEEMLNTWRGVSRRGLDHIKRLETALDSDVGAATENTTMNKQQEKDIIRTLVKAGHESLAKTFARSRGYRVKAAPRKRVKAQTFDPRKAMIYFDLVFEDYNFEEDQENDPKRAERFLKLGGGDPSKAALKAEQLAMKEAQKILKVKRIGNEGHGSGGELVCKISVDSVEEARKIFDKVEAEHGGGDDVVYLDAPYMAMQGFTLFPQGVNGPQYRLGGSSREDIDDFWDEVE